jgi:hypothetical protein
MEPTYRSIGREQYKEFKSLYDLKYFDDPKEVERLLSLPGINEDHPLILPEFPVVMQVTESLSKEAAEKKRVRPQSILEAYQRLKLSDESDIICGWTDSNGQKCGGIMDEEVTPVAIYYKCRKDPNHRTRK